MDPLLLRAPDLQQLHQQCRTKIALGIALLEAAIRHKVPFRVLLFDSWYLAKELVSMARYRLQHFKNERAWYNLNLPRECIFNLLLNPAWYKLFIPPEEMQFTRCDRVRRWEEIAVALLKQYIDRSYKFRKQEWEADYLEYHALREDDPNFVTEYRLLIEASQDAIVAGYRGRVSHAAIREAVRLVTTQFLTTLPALESVG